MMAGSVTAQTFTNLHSFSYGSDGAQPVAGLVLSGTNLYGTTDEGGTGNQGFIVGTGTVFVVGTNGMGLATLQDFTPVFFGSNSDGAFPKAGLILAGNTLYGATSAGGSSDNGTVFAVSTNASVFTNVYNFTATSGAASTNSDGAGPVAGLILAGTNLYGATRNGGYSGNGTVFALSTNGTGFTNLHSFSATNGNGTNSDGAGPVAALVLSGTNLYGTAESGGGSGRGAVFAVSTNGLGFTNLHNFTGGSDGSDPVAGLTLSSNILYGTTTAGGSGGNGTVFAISINGTGFTNLHSFAATNNAGINSDGAVPSAGLVLSGDTLYGTAEQGGSSGNGTVFAVNIDGTGFTNLYSFTTTDDNGFNSDGANPLAGLILSGDILYGTSSAGGSSGYGTIFCLFLQPQLTINRSGAEVILTWTNPAPGFTLQSTTNLPPTVWSNVSPAAIVVNGQNTVTNPISGAQQFYRLSQ